MRTKNFLSIAALIICGLVCVNSVKAEGPSNTDNVTVNIRFKPIQAIVVNPSQKTVDLVYETKDHYASGVSSEQKDHLTVFSTGGFQVNVKSNGEFKRGDGAEVISAGDVKILASLGTNTAVGEFNEQALTTGDTPIITASEGGSVLNYNIKYDNTAAGASYQYINRYIHDDAESVYTAQVTYTIVSK